MNSTQDRIATQFWTPNLLASLQEVWPPNEYSELKRKFRHLISHSRNLPWYISMLLCQYDRRLLTRVGKSTGSSCSRSGPRMIEIRARHCLRSTLWEIPNTKKLDAYASETLLLLPVLDCRGPELSEIGDWHYVYDGVSNRMDMPIWNSFRARFQSGEAQPICLSTGALLNRLGIHLLGMKTVLVNIAFPKGVKMSLSTTCRAYFIR